MQDSSCFSRSSLQVSLDGYASSNECTQHKNSRITPYSMPRPIMCYSAGNATPRSHTSPNVRVHRASPQTRYSSRTLNNNHALILFTMKLLPMFSAPDGNRMSSQSVNYRINRCWLALRVMFVVLYQADALSTEQLALAVSGQGPYLPHLCGAESCTATTTTLQRQLHKKKRR